MALLLTTRAASPSITVFGKTLRASLEFQSTLPPNAERGTRKGSASCTQEPGLPAGPYQWQQGQSADIPWAGHGRSLGGAGKLPGSSHTDSVRMSGADGRGGCSQLG